MRFSPADTLCAYYYGRGVSHEAYQSMGAHLTNREGQDGVYFALWAPFAQSASVVGDFNAWDPTAHPMFRLGTSSLWECFVPGLGEGCLYKYAVTGEDENFTAEVIVPIYAEGDTVGAVMLLSREEKAHMGLTELKVAETAAGFVGKQMEQ